MVRHFSGFEGIGFFMILIPFVGIGFVVGIVFLIIEASRPIKDRDLIPVKGIGVFAATVLFGPLYLVALGVISSLASASDSVSPNPDTLLLIPIPVVSLLLAILGMRFAFRGHDSVAKLGRSALLVINSLEFMAVIAMLIPN